MHHTSFSRGARSVYDWCIVEAVSTYEFAQQRSILLQAFVVVGVLALLLALILASVFAERLVQPIRSMADAVDRIAQGQFDCALPRDSVQEYARLEQGIEQMQDDIRALLDSRVQQEKEKRKAELPYAPCADQSAFHLQYTQFDQDDGGHAGVTRYSEYDGGAGQHPAVKPEQGRGADHIAGGAGSAGAVYLYSEYSLQGEH